MTEQPRGISGGWRITIALVVLLSATAGWKVYGALTPEQQRVGVWVLIALFGIPLLIRWALRGRRARKPR